MELFKFSTGFSGIYIRVARLIHNLIPSIAKHEVLSEVKWHSLSYFRKKRLACIAYQAYYNLAPPSIPNVFTKHATNYNLREIKFDLTHTHWKGNNASLTDRASIIWNSLSVKIKSLSSFASFKANLVKHSKSIAIISLGCSSTSAFNNVLMILLHVFVDLFVFCYICMTFCLN